MTYSAIVGQLHDKTLNVSDKDIAKSLMELHPQMHIAYGGDGTLVNEWPIAKLNNKPILPIRNYGRCEKHDRLLHALFFDKESTLKELELKQTLHPLIRCSWMQGIEGCKTNHEHLALAEVQLKNKDITSALRCNINVNGKKYYDNVIADAIVVSTPLGSTGYWKSITRTIFREGYGLTFIAPTVGISSLILKSTDFVTIEFVRKTTLVVAADKIIEEHEVDVSNKIDIALSSDNMPIFGYDHFMCFECRKCRNSTILQDQYIV